MAKSTPATAETPVADEYASIAVIAPSAGVTFKRPAPPVPPAVAQLAASLTDMPQYFPANDIVKKALGIIRKNADTLLPGKVLRATLGTLGDAAAYKVYLSKPRTAKAKPAE